MEYGILVSVHFTSSSDRSRKNELDAAACSRDVTRKTLGKSRKESENFWNAIGSMNGNLTLSRHRAMRCGLLPASGP